MPTASFDVFDTLLTRTWAEPRDLFVQLGSRLREQQLSRLSPDTFAAERRAAERRARVTAPAGEVTLAAINAELAGRLGWSPAQCVAAQELEIALETESIRPVEAMRAEVARARAAAGRVLFISDMYLPATIIRGWLEQAGFFQPGDLLLVSNEEGAGKGTGALFEKARGRTGADFQAWSHVGDHPLSDHEVPRRLGIQTQPAIAGRLTDRERILRGPGAFAAPWRSLLAGAARQARLARLPTGESERDRTLWETGAAIAGPLFWAYTDWCLQEAEERGLEDLFFLARGGQIFFRIARMIQAARPGRVRCHYLHTSRLAFAGVADANDEARLRLLAAAPLAFHSVRQAFANLGLEPATELAPAELPPSQWDRNLTPAERSALASRLLEPEFRPRLAAALAERGRRARGYLAQAGLRAGAPIGLVDTGWMGTIQRSIEFLLGTPAAPAKLTGFYLGLSPVREFTCAGETLAYTNTFARLPLRRETTHLILLELMARGTHGPLLGFADEGGRMVPQFDPAIPAETVWFQDAVLAFVRARLAMGPSQEAPVPAELARAVIGAYREFFLHPTASEVRAFGRIPHADQMFEQRHAVLCPDLTLSEILRAIRDFHRRPPGWWLQGQAVLGHAPVLRAYLGLKSLKWTLQTRLLGKPD